MSAIFKPVTSFVKGIFGLGSQKLNKIKPMDISAQTSEEGNPQPVVWGISRPIGGNVIYQSQPIRVIRKEKVSGGGGKGGGGSKKQKVEYIYRYYAIRVCRGDGIIYRRIWRNNKLVYDARRGSEWGAKNNHLFLQKARLYSGSWDQMPDSILETQLGVGNVPAFRGLAYMVIDYEDVTDLGGAIPQYTFEVCRPNGFVLTSRPYALEDETSSMVTGVSIIGGQSSGTWRQSPVEEMNATGWVDSITMTRTTRYSSMSDVEEMNATGWVDSITMTRTTSYSSMDAGVEEMNATGWVDSITMTRTTSYSDHIVEPEEMNATGWVNEIIMTRTSG